MLYRPLAHAMKVLMEAAMVQVQVDMNQPIQVVEVFQANDILHHFHEDLMNFVDHLVLQEEDTGDVSVLEGHEDEA